MYADIGYVVQQPLHIWVQDTWMPPAGIGIARVVVLWVAGGGGRGCWICRTREMRKCPSVPVPHNNNTWKVQDLENDVHISGLEGWKTKTTHFSFVYSFFQPCYLDCHFPGPAFFLMLHFQLPAPPPIDFQQFSCRPVQIVWVKVIQYCILWHSSCHSCKHSLKKVKKR